MFLFRRHVQRVREKMRLMAIPMGKANFMHTRFTAETRKQFGFGFLQRVETKDGRGTVLGQFSNSLLIWSDKDQPWFVSQEELLMMKSLSESTPEYPLRLTKIINELFNENIVELAKNIADFERFEEKILSLYQEGNLELIAMAEANWDEWLKVAALTVELLAEMLQQYMTHHDQAFLERVNEVDQHTAIMQFTFSTLLQIKPDYADKTLMASYYMAANQLAQYFYTQALNNPEKKDEKEEALPGEERTIPNSVAALVCALMGANKEPFIHHACYLLWIKSLFSGIDNELMPHQFNLDEWYANAWEQVLCFYAHLMKDANFVSCCNILLKNKQPAVQFELAKWRYFYVAAQFNTSSEEILNRQDALNPILQLVRNNWIDAAEFLLDELKGPAFNAPAPCYYLDRNTALALTHYYGRSPQYSDNQLAWSFWQKGKGMPLTHSRPRDHSYVKTKLDVLFEKGNAQRYAIERLKVDAEAGHPTALQYLRETGQKIPAAALACLEIFARKKVLTTLQYEETALYYPLASKENGNNAARWYCDILKQQKKLTLSQIVDWVEQDYEFAIAELELKIKWSLKKDNFNAIEKEILPLLERPKVLENLLPELVILLIQYMDKIWREEFRDEEQQEDENASLFCNDWLLAFLYRLKSMELTNKKQLVLLLLLDITNLLSDEGCFVLFQLTTKEYTLSQLLANPGCLQIMASLVVTYCQETRNNLFKLQIEALLINNPHVVQALVECKDSFAVLKECQMFRSLLDTLAFSREEQEGSDSLSSAPSLH